MPRILLVEDDRSMLYSLRDGLKHFNYAFQVFTAENGELALQILKSQPVDVVVTDLMMPVMNGFELLVEIHEHYPFLPVIVMTGFGSSFIELNLKNYGRLQYIEKPLDLNLLVDKIFDQLVDHGGNGLKIVFLPSFLKLIELEKKTCTLLVKSQEKNGYLFFSKGLLIDAEYQDMNCDDSAREIIRWNETEVSIDCQNTRSEKRTTMDMDELIYRNFQNQEDGDQGANPGGGESPEQDDTHEFSKREMKGLLPSLSENSAKEKRMNAKKLNDVLSKLQEDLGDSLLATDVWTVNDAVSLAGFNPQPKAVALFNRITQTLNRTLTGSGFPEIGEYYMLKLIDKKMVIVIPLGDYQWGILIDERKIQLGLVVNVAIPNLVQGFQRAINDQ